jgi:hypothetical protein
MRRGSIGNRVRLTIPLIYVEPKILFKDNEVDTEVAKVLHDIWLNYNVNIRYLHVLSHNEAYFDSEGTLSEVYSVGLPYELKQETTTEDKLLTHLNLNTVVAFFGRREMLPTNHKVYSRDELINEYHVILSNLNTRDKVTKRVNRYQRRRG